MCSLHYSVNGGAEQTREHPQAAGREGSQRPAHAAASKTSSCSRAMWSASTRRRRTTTRSRRPTSALSRWIRLSASSRSRSRAAAAAAAVAAAAAEQPDRHRAAREGADRGDLEAGERQDQTAEAEDKAAAAWARCSPKRRRRSQQALALSARMQSRDLSEANEEFNSFEKDMEQAAAACSPRRTS